MNSLKTILTLLRVRSSGLHPLRRPFASVAGEGMALPAPAGGDPATTARLLEELRAAHREWACARQRLDYAMGDDEIDYAIFAMETAEKRYGMLLKQAKLMKLSGFGTQTSSLLGPQKGKG